MKTMKKKQANKPDVKSENENIAAGTPAERFRDGFSYYP
jgi:hypothetical protein